MKKLLVLAMFVGLGLAATTARAGQNVAACGRAESASVPVVDQFEDGEQRLKLIGLPAPEGDAMQVTLVYEDGEQQVMRSVTVDPTLVATTHAGALQAFLDEMDPDFVSYVRAALADRLMHLKAQPSQYDRAVSALFFPRASGGRLSGGLVMTVEENLTAE